MRIDDVLAAQFVSDLSERSGMSRNAFRYEIQDDWSSLLITVAADKAQTDKDRRSFLKLAQELAGQMIPSAEGRYTWTISILANGQVVDAVFGGDRLNPSSGCI